MKNGNKTSDRSETLNCNDAGHTGQGEDVMKKLSIMATIIVAALTTLAFATPAMAQASTKPVMFCQKDGECKTGEDDRANWKEDWTTCPVDCPVPVDLPRVNFLDPAEMSIIFRHKSWTAFDVAVNAYGFKEFEDWMRTYAPDGFEGLFKSFIKNRGTVDAMTKQARDFISPAADTFGYFRLSDADIAELETKWDEFLKSQGCEKESDQGCQDFLRKASTYVWNVLQIPSENDKYVATNFLKGFMNTQLRIKRKIAITLAVLDTLPDKYSRPLFRDEAGEIVSPAQLVDRTGDYLSASCFGRSDVIRGTIGPLTNAERVEIRGQGQIPFTELCVFYVVETGSVINTQCELGLEARDAGRTYEGKEFFSNCPEDLESLVGRSGFLFPEDCVEPVAVTVAEVTSDKVILRDSNGTTYKVDCGDINLIFALDPEPIIEKPPIGKLQLELVGFYLGNPGGAASNADGAMASGAMARLVYTPWANQYVAIHGRLGLGGMKVWGLTDASKDDTQRGDLLASIGLGTSVVFNRVFSMSLHGDIFFTTAGFGGGGGELLARFRLHERVSLFFGPALGYLVSGVKPGSNPKFEACNSGPACKSMPNTTEFFYLGGVLGFAFDLVKPVGNFKAEAEASTEPEAAGPTI